MTKKPNYRVISNELNLILFIKGITLEQERKLYESIRAKIKKETCELNIDEYKQFIVRKLLVDADKFISRLPSDLDDAVEAFNYAYESIITLYPPFSLEFICTDLNTSVFMSGVDKELLNKITEGRGVIPTTKNSISLADIENTEEYFRDNIVGQEEAITKIIKALKLIASGLSSHSSFLFVGPTGVGKTEVGKLLGKKFSGNFFKVNCAEFAGGHEYAKLIGSPPGYIGHSEQSLLAEKAEESNRWVFLFDEIEKAHYKLYDFLLSLLDDGTCTDNMGKVLDFSESIFIFTSNQGAKEANNTPVGFTSDDLVKEKVTGKGEVYKDSIKNHFSPEFLNRIDDIVVFNTLSKPDVRQITKLQLELLPIKQTKALVDYIVDNGYSEEYGARNIARFIKNNISDKIADAILNKLVPKRSGGFYSPRIEKGKVRIVSTIKYNMSSV